MSYRELNTLSQPISQKRQTDQFFNRKYKKMLNLDKRFNPSFHYENEDIGYVHWAMELTNLNREDIDITIKHDVITVTGRSDIIDPANRQSQPMSSIRIPFNFSMVLPKGYHRDDINAQIDDGSLHISIPYDRPEEGPQKVPIN